ncbi:intercellular adhesion molecule 4-like [Carettochelys insculpta]|uniref:intercellular adhesion molecule 4-like n=1 Tax=Carettochelys insculpta TaxID=44489 RepID=UPI003EBCFB81
MGPQGLQKHSPLHSLALLLLLGVLPGAAQGSFEVRISPRTAVVEYGGSVWINCSTTCQDRDAPIGLEIPLTKELSRTGPGWIAMHIVNISEWESNSQCYVNCNTTHKLVKGTISAYRAPEQVVLEPLPALVLGQTHTLTCRVWGVAPVRHLTVSLRQGNRTLHTETFHNRTGAGPDNVTVTHEITPQRWDHGQQVTCFTALDLTPHWPLIRNSSAVAELRVYYRPRMDDSGCPRSRIWVKGTKQIFCEAQGSPTPTVECVKPGVVFQGAEQRLVSSEDAGTYNCTASNEYGTVSREVMVHVDDPTWWWLKWVLVVVGVLVLAAGVGYLVYVWYCRTYKVGSYWLKPKETGKAAEQHKPSELRSLNGAAESTAGAEQSV